MSRAAFLKAAAMLKPHGFILLACLFLSLHGEPAPPALQPGLAKLQTVVRDLVTERWYEATPTECLRNYQGPDHHLTSIGVSSIKRHDDLLPYRNVLEGRHEVSGPDTVYVVNAEAVCDWWKLTSYHVLVLRPGADHWDVLLHVDGGGNWRGVDSAVVNLGVHEERPAIMVSDYGCGNQCSQTRTHFFLYKPEADAFAEVFNELTTFLPSWGPVYSGEILLGLGDQELCDIIVDNEFWVCPRALPRAKRRTVFRWDGARYVGQMPAAADVLNWTREQGQ
jgi:hypothetical protein